MESGERPARVVELDVVAELDFAGRRHGLVVIVVVHDDLAAELVHRSRGDERLHLRPGQAEVPEGAQHARVLHAGHILGPAHGEVVAGVDDGRGLVGRGLQHLALLPHPLEHAHERRHEAGVELCAGAALQLGEALAVGERGAVDAPRRHGVVRVHQAEQSRHHRDLLPGQPVRVPLAVPALVVVAHSRHVALVQQRLDDLRADHRVPAHEPPLLVGQRARLEQHAVRHGDLADVVQVRGLLELLDGARRPVQLLREQHRVGGDPGGVADGVEVLGAQRGAQGAQVAEVHALHIPEQLGVVDGQRRMLCEPAGELEVGVGELALRQGLDEGEHPQGLPRIAQRDGEASLLSVEFHGVAHVGRQIGVGDRLDDHVVGLEDLAVGGIVAERVRLVDVLVDRRALLMHGAHGQGVLVRVVLEDQRLRAPEGRGGRLHERSQHVPEVE